MVDHAPPIIEASYDKASLRDQNKCPLYGIAWCPLLRGVECIEVGWQSGLGLGLVEDSIICQDCAFKASVGCKAA